VDQRLETKPELPDTVGDPQGEIRVTVNSDQLCPPVGVEVSLNRTDGTRIPVILDRIEDEGTNKILVFKRLVPPMNIVKIKIQP
jgi:hypothetical protein